jgi:MFS family permease
VTTTKLDSGPLAPLGIGLFRSLWIAQLVSNIGSWMQSVGAQWFLVESPNATLLTALASAAGLLPVLILSLPAGVLADALDRRRLLIWSSAFMCLAAGLLTVLTWAGQAGPGVVLGLTFALGCGSAIGGPAWQAIQPDLVPRDLLLTASAISSANVNIARAAGPALAGVLVAWAGPELVFGINALSFLAVISALWAWRTGRGSKPGAAVKTATTEHHPAASSYTVTSQNADTIDGAAKTADQSHRIRRLGMAPATVTGLRYVRNAPGVRRITLRAAVFVVPASALWALLAVLTHGQLGLGPSGYGLMLAALGVGAVGGALALPYLRGRASNNAILAGGSLIYGVGMVAVGVITNPAVVAGLLVVAGGGWVACLSVLNTAMLLSLPAWVRARSMAVYTVVFIGGQGIGSLLWGAVGAVLGPRAALLAAAAIALACLSTLPIWPLYRSTGTLDRGIAPMPEVMPEKIPAASAGPVQIQIEYQVAPVDVAAFRRAARAVAASRRRTGANSWALWQDVMDERLFIEQYSLPDWAEHMAQREERMTGYDRELEGELLALAAPNPAVRHLIRPSAMPRVDHGIAVADLKTRETST